MGKSYGLEEMKCKDMFMAYESPSFFLYTLSLNQKTAFNNELSNLRAPTNLIKLKDLLLK
jgi:hypothetical protein